MRPAAPALLALLVAAASAWPAAGQDMAAAAAREKERREKAGKKAQAFTNDDLPKAPPKASPAPGGAPEGRPMDEERLRRLSGGGSAATAPSSGTATEAKGEGEGGERSGDERGSASEGKDEASWRRRGEAARDAVSRAEADVVRIQKALDDVRRGQTQPLPIDAMRQVPPNALTPPPDADRLAGELEAAKAAVVAAKQALADLEEEARKAGVPPGWLR